MLRERAVERGGDAQVGAAIRVLKGSAVALDLLSFLSRALSCAALEIRHFHRLLYLLYRILVDIVLYIIQCC